MDEIRIRPCGAGWSYCDGCCDTCMTSYRRATNRTEETAMDNYTETKQAYDHGYEKGYEKGLMELPNFGEVVYRKNMEKLENDIYQAIVKVGITVDKDKIAKALTDARAFYAEGYEQGLKDAVKWISVEERLPERSEYNFKEYIVNIMRSHWPKSSYDWVDAPYSEEYTTTACYDCEQKVWNLVRSEVVLNALINPEDAPLNGECVTHWMPLPEPPKGELYETD